MTSVMLAPAPKSPARERTGADMAHPPGDEVSGGGVESRHANGGRHESHITPKPDVAPGPPDYTMTQIDLASLRQHLKSIGWTMSRLTDIVDVTAENRSTIWHLIRPDAMAVRIEVLRVRAVFPGARVVRIA